MEDTRSHQRVTFPRPLPYPNIIYGGTWVLVCGWIYWLYVILAGPHVSVAASVGYWIVNVGVVPAMAWSRGRQLEGLVPVTIAVLVIGMLLQAAVFAR